ncbi:saccharopine dehydrogenase NADP-binding domain-containing protein [Pseudonocardia lacus]|uniref:saccharopine dehydrogenase NADP-binding domain-containing protein n=1 Tax=Pseudonocardia lacus TaxID=2835865 RepID=UPI001BDC0329|nr:saccharopine dehydrogenase NADP-binding domain-containing protein [Pseudonocardia lacus]
MSPPIIAVYGATGHTGRLVATELLARGHRIVLAGRDAIAVQKMTTELDAGERVEALAAPLDDPGALRELAAGCTVLVHCAGPYSETGRPVAEAAVAAGCHYVDHALEQHHVRSLFDELDRPARDAGSALVPGASFYGGYGDLLAAVVAAGLPEVRRLVIGYAVAGWRMTAGARRTADQVIADLRRVTFTDGALDEHYVEPRNAVFPFPPPLGPQSMVAPVPYHETITVPRHVPAREVEAQMTAHTFAPETFEGQDVDDATRAGSEYTVAVQAITADGGRTGLVTGRDLWWGAALVSVEVALALAEPPGPARGGVFAPAEAVDAGALLARLERRGAFTASPGLLPDATDEPLLGIR